MSSAPGLETHQALYSRVKVPGFDYVKTWEVKFAKAMQPRTDSTNTLEPDPHFCPFLDNLPNHRLDRFIWPALQYRFGTQRLTPIPTRN
jgi:hypothetical protein